MQGEIIEDHDEGKSRPQFALENQLLSGEGPPTEGLEWKHGGTLGIRVRVPEVCTEVYGTLWSSS